jgi:hypothetical protein
MNHQGRESAERETHRAISADENANALYYQLLRRFISDESSEPQARLDQAGLKAIEAAWLKINNTNKNLRRAYMKLYCADL